jgi:peptidoglycan/xylan/chitin deacetylase (PgdA/CDA1 family)
MSGATPPLRPKRRGPGFPDLELVPDAGPRIALTFDGGSDGNGAGQVLDALQRLGVRATLFVTGRFIEQHPGFVRRALLEGHEVGNHTMRHPHLTTYEQDRRQRLRPEMTKERFRQELLSAEAAFLRATARPMAPLWRAPYGEENSTLRRWAFELGYLHVRWSLLKGHSLDSRDWVADEHSPLYEDTERMVDRLLRFPHLQGGLVLMHLGSKRAHPAWSRLPDLVQRLRARGLEVVPVSELLAASPTWSPRLQEAARRHRATVRSLRH